MRRKCGKPPRGWGDPGGKFFFPPPRGPSESGLKREKLRPKKVRPLIRGLREKFSKEKKKGVEKKNTNDKARPKKGNSQKGGLNPFGNRWTTQKPFLGRKKVWNPVV